jgi:hypothetical protein
MNGVRSQIITLSGHAEPEQTLSYLHLPFDVPANTERIGVRYEYSAAISSDPQITGGSTVDIGIFDTRGTDFMTEGFRGWSGSARQSFFIGIDEATPGYMPGPIQTGIWFICLGLYKVAPDGCDYRVKIELTIREDALPSVEFPKRLPLRSTPDAGQPNWKRSTDGWYKGELHCHTYHSDGDSDPMDVVRRAEALDLDFLAITDHNVLSQLVTLNNVQTPLMLIPGCEVTTYKGHWNIWGDTAAGWIDFRILTEEAMRTAVSEALQRGYTVSCNHPRPYGPEWVYDQIEGFHTMEVWNGPWQLFNTSALAFWEKKLHAGQRYTAVGGSDCHFHARDHIAKLAQPTNWIYVVGDPSPAKLLEAMRAGHVFITDKPDGARLFFNIGDAMTGDSIPRESLQEAKAQVRIEGAEGSLLELHTDNGCVHRELISTQIWENEILLSSLEQPLYLRAQVVENSDSSSPANVTIKALTNPIYFT